MDIHKKNKKVQVSCCRLLKHLHKGLFGFGQMGGVDLLMGAMIRFPDSHMLQNYGLSAIKSISKIKPNAEYLIQENAGHVIRIAMKTFPKKVEIQKVAIAATNSLLKTERIKIKLFEEGLAHYILEAIRAFIGNKKLVFNGLMSLMDFGCEYSLLQLNAHTVVLKAMTAHVGDKKIIETACATLKAFATMEVNVDMLLDAGAVKVLLNCLDAHFGTAKIQEVGCLAFWCFGLWDDKKMALIRKGVCNYVNRLCLHYRDNPKVLENGLSVLNNLATIREASQQMLSTTIFDTIFDCAQRNIESPAVQERFISVVKTFLSFDFEEATQLRSIELQDFIDLVVTKYYEYSIVRNKGNNILSILRITEEEDGY